MSLSYLRDAVIKRLQDKVDAAAEKAINMRVHQSSTADGYALTQADTLAEARAFAEAQKIIIDEYKRLTDAPETRDETPEAETTAPKQNKETSIYG